MCSTFSFFLMAGKIQRLPEYLINQIAAGEVVERPASVVKELLENAIDAGARHIVIEVKDGGDNFLRITDDGIGMDSDDAVMALERHATSKIATADDLIRIGTLGFRGEALASIASVSFLTLQTKKRGALEGTVLNVEGGKIDKIKPGGMPEGTQIEIRQLFYNTPARKKYLKNPLTEYNHIFNTVTGIALAFPGIAFKLVHHDKIIFDLARIEADLPEPSGTGLSSSRFTENLFPRIRQLMGKNISDELIPVFYGHSRIQLAGFIGKPIIARSNRNMQYLFVNHREIKSPVLSYAAKESYYSLLPKEKYPVFFLYLDIDPELVDVNVHPRKQEVRFVNEREIFKIVAQACQKALETHILAPKIDASTPQNYYYERRQAPLLLHDRPDYRYEKSSASNMTTRGTPPSGTTPTLPASPALVQAALSFTKNFTEKMTWNSSGLSAAPDLSTPSQDNRSDAPEAASFIAESRQDQAPLVPLAQLDASFILCQRGSDLVIIDQHAAHERIRYTELVRDFEKLEQSSQPLLVPLSLELPPKDVAAFENFLETFRKIGFDIIHFGGNTFSIQAIPNYGMKGNLQQTVLGLFDDLVNHKEKGDFQRRKERSLLYMACRSAKKFGDILSREEQIALVEKLMALDAPYTCPHGRPTMIVMSSEELKKRFGRYYNSF